MVARPANVRVVSKTGSVKQKLLVQIQRARNSIFEFCKLIGFVPVGGQVEFLRRIEYLTLNPHAQPRQIGCKAGTGVGKTATLTVAMLWRTWRHAFSFGVATAPTERQCREVYFAETGRLVTNSPYLQSIVNVKGGRLEFKGYPKWQIYGATASDENALRGLHHKGLSVGAEEITGIADTLLDALLRTCSQDGNLWMGIFNPDDVTGLAYRMFHEEAQFWPFNLTIDKLSIARENSEIVSPRILEQWRRAYGEDSDFWRVGVLGEFPLKGAKSVIGVHDMELASMNDKIECLAYAHQTRVVALDCARFGGDENVITVRSGNSVLFQEAMVCDPNEAAARAREIITDLGWTDTVLVVLDCDGMGQALVYDFLEAGMMVHEFHAADKSPIPGFADLLSAAFFTLRTKMMTQKVYIPEDPVLTSQISTRRYTYRKGKIEVESKSDYVKRGFKKSPDRADSLVMAFTDITDMQETITDEYVPFIGDTTMYREYADDYRLRLHRRFEEHFGYDGKIAI